MEKGAKSKKVSKYRSSGPGCSVKKVFLASAYNFIKKATLPKVFSGEFSEISKSILSYRAPPVAASAYIFSKIVESVNVMVLKLMCESVTYP